MLDGGLVRFTLFTTTLHDSGNERILIIYEVRRPKQYEYG